MERNLISKKTIAALFAILLCLMLGSCTKLPRQENVTNEPETDGQTQSETVTQENSEAATDANGFPNEAEDGYTKRY